MTEQEIQRKAEELAFMARSMSPETGHETFEFPYQAVVNNIATALCEASAVALKPVGHFNSRELGEMSDAIHYPAHWDQAAYPTLSDAIYEIVTNAGCSECADPQQEASAPEPDCMTLPELPGGYRIFDLLNRHQKEVQCGRFAAWEVVIRYDDNGKQDVYAEGKTPREAVLNAIKAIGGK